MSLLKRELAPIPAEAWDRIDEEARRVLKLHLGGRKLVDFDGPHGWRRGGVNLGRLTLLEKQPVPGVHLGLRQVQPLAELRTPIKLDVLELDSVARGSEDPELSPVVEAAERVALLEDTAIFRGFPELQVEGIIEASPHDAIELPEDPSQFPHAITRASETLRQAGIDGPYGMALGPRPYEQLTRAAEDGYPIYKRLARIIDGPIVWTPAVDGAVLLSVAGGDFVLTVGQDLSVGYADHDRDTVELFMAESFTFRVLEPAAAVYLLANDERS